MLTIFLERGKKKNLVPFYSKLLNEILMKEQWCILYTMSPLQPFVDCFFTFKGLEATAVNSGHSVKFKNEQWVQRAKVNIELNKFWILIKFKIKRFSQLKRK